MSSTEIADKKKDWTLIHDGDCFNTDVQVPEPGYSPNLSLKNRNCILLFRHRYVNLGLRKMEKKLTLVQLCIENVGTFVACLP